MYRSWLIPVSTWISLILFSFVRTVVPGQNESHYLTRARHFWDPAWLAGDFFLESSSPHAFFYAVFGWIPLLLPFDTAAILGRCLALAVVAWGWCRLFSRLHPAPAAPLWICWCWLLLAAIGNLSGEWLVGGVESKVFSWGLAFAAASFLLDGRTVMAALLGGLAVSFHPVVGGWAALCAAAATGLIWCDEWRIRQRQPATAGPSAGGVALPAGTTTSAPPPGFPVQPDRRTLLSAAVAFLCAAVPGLWPAVRTLQGAAPAEQYQGDFLQVFHRLAHHLDPLAFSSTAWFAYLGMFAVWVIGVVAARWLRPPWPAIGRPGDATAWFHGFIAAALLLAFAGVLAGIGPRPPHEMPGLAWRMKFLKLYPFRLADILLPAAISLLFCRLLWNLVSLRSHRVLAMHSLCSLALLTALLLPAPDRRPGGLSPAAQREWIAACRWIEKHTPEDALFYAPNDAWGFKWWTERREFVSYKDTPQGARGLLEWNRRLNTINRLISEDRMDTSGKPHSPLAFTRSELQALRAETGITHLLVWWVWPFSIETIYSNRLFRVYELPAPDSASY